MSTVPSGVYTLATAMARQEGYYALPPGRPARNNNPGDIAWTGINGFAALNGALHGDNGIHTPMAVFPDLTTGYRAMRKLLNIPAQFNSQKQLVSGYVGATIAQIITRYCPPTAPGNSPQGTATYIHNVCSWMQCTPDTVVTVAMI